MQERLRAAQGSPTFLRTYREYVRDYGMPDDLQTLMLLLDLDDERESLKVMQAIEATPGTVALEKIQGAMLKIITELAKDRKANLVFQRSELVLFDQAFDVTDEVLHKLDEQLPTLTVNFVPPQVAPSATPAAAAAATDKGKKKKENPKQ